MKTYEVTRYGFNELSPEAQAKAIEQVRAGEQESFPQELLSEAMDEQASYLLAGNYEAKQSELKLYYSLSYSQGDGVAMHGTIYPADAPNLTLPANTYRVNIKHEGRYYHEYSFNVELLDENYDEIDDTDGKVLEQLRNICKQLARFGYKWDENYFSDKNMQELAENMGEVFTSTGTISEPVRNWSAEYRARFSIDLVR